MGAAVHGPGFFYTMPNDSAAAVFAFGSQHVDRAFKAIKRVLFPGHHHFKTFVVVIAAAFATCHDWTPLLVLQFNIRGGESEWRK
jgi:hypothetical protein